MQPHLAGFRTIAFDPPGIGATDMPGRPYTVRRLAAFAAALVYYLSKYAVMTAMPASRLNANAREIGEALFEAYLFPFEMVSILLLAAIVGALLLSGR